MFLENVETTMNTESPLKRPSETQVEKLPTKKAKAADAHATTDTGDDATEYAPSEAPKTVVGVERHADSSTSMAPRYDKVEYDDTQRIESSPPTGRINGANDHPTLIPKPRSSFWGRSKTPEEQALPRRGGNGIVTHPTGSATPTTTKTNVVTPQCANRSTANAAHRAAQQMTEPKIPTITASKSQTRSLGRRLCSFLLLAILSTLVLMSFLLILSNLVSLGLLVHSRMETELQIRELAMVTGIDSFDLLSYGATPAVALSRILEGFEIHNKSHTAHVIQLEGQVEDLTNKQRTLIIEKSACLNIRQKEQERQAVEVQQLAKDKGYLRAQMTELEERLQKQQALHSKETVETEERLRAVQKAQANEREEWKAKLQQLEAALQDSTERTDELSQLRQLAEQATSDRDASSQKVKELEEELEDLMDEQRAEFEESLRAQFQEHLDEIRTLMGKRDTLLSQTVELEGQVQAIRDEISAKSEDINEVDRLRESVRFLEKENNGLVELCGDGS